MHKIKTTLAVLGAMLLAVTSLPLQCISAETTTGSIVAEEEAAPLAYDIFLYTVTDGSVTLSGCDRTLLAQAMLEGTYPIDAPYQITIPAEIDGMPVTAIGDNAFANVTLSRKYFAVTVPDSVKTLGNGAFQNTLSLVSVTLPEAMTHIGSEAFSKSTRLAAVTMPKTLETLGEKVFAGCTALKTASIPDGITEIPTGTFMTCTAMDSVTLPEGITAIGISAFQNCSAADLFVPETVTSIGNYAYNASGMQKLHIQIGRAHV